jgi:hypothetical protein
MQEFWLGDVLDIDYVALFRHLPLLKILHVGFEAPTVLAALTPELQGPILCPNLYQLYIRHSSSYSQEILDLVCARRERDVPLGKLHLYISGRADEIEWMGEVDVEYDGGLEARFEMGIPEKFTESRHDHLICHEAFLAPAFYRNY